MPDMPRRRFLHGCAAWGIAAAAHLSRPGRARSESPLKPAIRVGQIGVGHAHAGGKMDALRRLHDDFEVVGIVEPDVQRREAAQRQPVYQNLRWMTEEELLNVKGLRAVVVETNVQDLVPTAARAVAAGMHLHLDKPAGESLAAYRQMLDEATRRRLTVQMGFMFRYNPAFRLCFQAVREGWLGEVFELHGVISSNYQAEARKPLLPYRGGIMFELGCHLIDAMITVLGKPTSVSAFPRRMHPEWDTVFDNQLAVFEFPRATATIRSTLVEVSAGSRRQFVVCGNRGTVDIRPIEPPLAGLTLARACGEFRKGHQEVQFPKPSGRYDDQLREFAGVVRGEKKADYSAEHDLAVHETVLRASGVL